MTEAGCLVLAMGGTSEGSKASHQSFWAFLAWSTVQAFLSEKSQIVDPWPLRKLLMVMHLLTFLQSPGHHRQELSLPPHVAFEAKVLVDGPSDSLGVNPNLFDDGPHVLGGILTDFSCQHLEEGFVADVVDCATAWGPGNANGVVIPLSD